MYPISCLSVHLLSLKQLMTNVTTLKKNLQAADKWCCLEHTILLGIGVSMW